MNVDDGLWQRLSEYSPDDPDARISFSARLRRENDWSDAYTQRVVEEYRRFLYLVCTAEHEVTPSEDVDAAWHLHLVHTRSYWDELCGEVLRRPIHHGPTKGGGKERQRSARAMRTRSRLTASSSARRHQQISGHRRRRDSRRQVVCAG